ADRDFIADSELLKLGEQAVGARSIEIPEHAVEPVVAVESATLVAQLHQPRPDEFRSCIDGDRERGRVVRRYYACVALPRAHPLDSCRPPSEEPLAQRYPI